MNYKWLGQKTGLVAEKLVEKQFDEAMKIHKQIMAEIKTVGMETQSIEELVEMQRIMGHYQNTWATYNTWQRRKAAEAMDYLMKQTGLGWKGIMRIIEGQGVLAL